MFLLLFLFFFPQVCFLAIFIFSMRYPPSSSILAGSPRLTQFSIENWTEKILIGLRKLPWPYNALWKAVTGRQLLYNTRSYVMTLRNVQVLKEANENWYKNSSEGGESLREGRRERNWKMLSMYFTRCSSGDKFRSRGLPNDMEQCGSSCLKISNS